MAKCSRPGSPESLSVFGDIGPLWMKTPPQGLLACRTNDLLISARPRLVVEMWSGAGSHVRGEDVVGVAVEVLAGPVIAHGGARVGVPGGDLDIAQSTPASSMVVTNVICT